MFKNYVYRGMFKVNFEERIYIRSLFIDEKKKPKPKPKPVLNRVNMRM